jgi:hypothetical protein
MTLAELALFGRPYAYWPDAASVTANQPLLFQAQRAEIDGLDTWLHGRSIGLEPQGGEDQLHGDPLATGSNPANTEPIRLVTVPTAGCATALP